MSKIVTTSDLQKNIGKISKEVEQTFFIVTNRGLAKMVLMPYFDDNDDLVQNYLEEYQMRKNKKELQKRYTQSIKSGKSNLKV